MSKNLLFVGRLLILIVCLQANQAFADFKLGEFIKKGTEVVKQTGKIISTVNGESSESNASSASGSISQSTRGDEGQLRAKSDIEGISIKVKTCKRDENDNVVIVFTLGNSSGSNAECQLRSGNSEVFDDEGNSYSGDKYIRFADMNERFQPVWDAKLPDGIPVKYRMKIINVDPDATMLKKVTIFMYELPIGSLTGRVHLYNVPISRPGD